MTIKSNPCKFISDDGTACLSPFHTKMYHKPRQPLKRSSIKKTVTKASKPKAPVKKAKKRSYYVKRLDDVFSIFIRKRDDGKGCVTCGVVKPWKEMQACHYESRGHIPTRWDERNVHSGCYSCNVMKKGNYTEYVLSMIRMYGGNILQDMHDKSRSGINTPTSDIKEMIDAYTDKVKEML